MNEPKRKSAWRLPVWIAGLALLATGCLSFIGCSTPIDPWKDTTGKRIMTSFAPVYCFVANVAGDDATVRCLLAATGPHDYQPTTKDALQLHGADLFFINGLELDSELARRLASNSGNPNLKVIDLGKCPTLKDKLRSTDKDSDGCCGHHHGDTDPHVWLGIPEAIAITECIRDELCQADPAHKEGYTRRAAESIAKLQKLRADGLKELADKKDRNLVTFHDSLQYFARSFDLKVVASIQPMAGAEPDAGRFARLVDVCKRDKVRVLAVEPQYPRTTAATALLDEIRAKGVPDPVFVEVDPIETAPPGELTPDYYERRMRGNLENLAKAMR